jgi:H/ACA ribonucleoprotein complex subunit 2
LRSPSPATKKSALLRGVKEVNKALRKAPTKTAATTEVPGVVVIAGDISPAEVIMHLPVYCEERNVPYIFVPSRAELGAAAKTKRPTSVVMLLAQGRKRTAAAAADKAKKPEAVEEDDGEDDYPKAYQDLVSTAQKEFGKQLRGLL